MKFNISSIGEADFKEDLCYMHVDELKGALEFLQLSTKGFSKKELVNRLLHYVSTGEELPVQEIPAISKAKPGVNYPLNAETLMLYGSYKNDYTTRSFFKKLIGPHFAYTAQGIDWLRERWLEGNPPTYAEFAAEWKLNYDLSKKQKIEPKQEWAYIRFIQDYMQKFPKASKNKMISDWEITRKEHSEKARLIIIYAHKFYTNK